MVGRWLYAAEPAREAPAPLVPDVSAWVSQPILELSILETLQAETTPEVLQQVVSLYIQELGERSVALSDAMAVQDASLAAAHAHAIKSSSGALGAMALYQAASELERACRQPQMALANQIHQQLPALIEQTQGRLQHHFQAVCRG